MQSSAVLCCVVLCWGAAIHFFGVQAQKRNQPILRGAGHGTRLGAGLHSALLGWALLLWTLYEVMYRGIYEAVHGVKSCSAIPSDTCQTELKISQLYGELGPS
jgi:hypothetical protein